MRNSILAGVLLVCTFLGFVLGDIHRTIQNQDDIDQAWSSITVVKDGTLIANPAAYAYDPQSLAAAQNVRIIDNNRAGVALAFDAGLVTNQ